MLGDTIECLQQTAKAFASAGRYVQAQTLGQAHDPGEVVFLFLARVTGDHRVDPALPPGGAAIEIGHRQVATVAERRATVTGRAVAVHQHIEAVDVAHCVRERQVALERTNVLMVDHQHFHPRVVIQMQGLVDPVDVGHHRIRYTGVAHVGDA
ncbi:hypothetical protein D3C77_379720 [compost metagenome]